MMTASQPMDRQQFVLLLQRRIEQGHYAPGSWLPAERVLAREFGLDRSAIRHALTQLQEQGLIVREAGRRPWVSSGVAMRSSNGSVGLVEQSAPLRPQTIAAVLPQHPLYPASLAIMHGINAELRAAEAAFRLQVIDTHGGSECQENSLEKQALESVAQENIAGVVLWHVGGEDTLPQVRHLQQQGVPVVFVDRYPSGLACDFVGSDNHSGVETALEHLRHLGHRRIAHLTTDEQTTSVLERRLAYTEHMTAAGQPPPPEWIYQTPYDAPACVSAACDQFFSCPEPPTAVLAMNDALAHHFIVECQARGISVPGDVSVVGFDDLERYSPRPALLTTLHQPFDKMGRRAAALLLQRLADTYASSPSPRQHILLPAPLVKRATCCAPHSISDK